MGAVEKTEARGVPITAEPQAEFLDQGNEVQVPLREVALPPFTTYALGELKVPQKQPSEPMGSIWDFKIR